MRKMLSFLIIVFLTAAIVAGCGGDNNGQTDPPAANGSGGEDDGSNGTALPEPQDELDVWIEASRTIFVAQSREVGDIQYLLVTYGMKGSGGYGVTITGVEIREEHVDVTVKFTRPKPGQEVTDAIEYPFDIMEIPATGLPAVFTATGAEEYVPHLVGLDYLRPVVAASHGIKVFTPSPETVIERRFAVEGVANVFEGNIQYKLRDEAGTVLFSGFETAAMGDWGYFDIDVQVDDTVPVAEQLLLELYTESAKDGEINDLVEIPLTLHQ